MNDGDIRVLIVEDLKSVALALRRLLGGFDIVGVAHDGRTAVRLASSHAPHVTTVDINLPDANGLELTRTLLAQTETSVIIVSALTASGRQNVVFEALRAGAYDVVGKESLFSAHLALPTSSRLQRLVRSAATGQLARRRSVNPPAGPSKDQGTPMAGGAVEPKPAKPGPKSLVAIGASTGGPPALHTVLSNLPPDFPVPIVVAQHIADGFVDGLVRWLDSQCKLHVCIATNGERPRQGTVYFPPSLHHLEAAEGVLRVVPAHGTDPSPSVDRLFESVARSVGSRALCVLLTGMASDGAAGLKQARLAHAGTAVQDEASCAVFGMPKAALAIGATDTVLALHDIPSWLVREAMKGRGRKHELE